MELADIKGFGTKRIEFLHEKNIFTPLDLLRVEPNKYLDYSSITGADKQNPNTQTIKVQILTIAKIAYFKGKSSVSTRAMDVESGLVFTLVWYNQPFMKNNLKMDDVMFVTGKFNKLHQFVVSSQIMSEKVTNDIIPVYSATAVLSNQIIRNGVRQILETGENFSVLTPEREAEWGLMPLNTALKELHFPTSILELEGAKRRICLEDMLLLSALEDKIKQSQHKKDRVYDLSAIDKFLSVCPYTLTADQLKALNETTIDMLSQTVMNRMILGDVGSGKTVVALGACYVAINSGYQATILCPTEILAEQHFESAKKLLSPLKCRIEILHSKLPITQRRKVLEDLASGEIDLLISTHSSLGEQVKFKNLALVVTDEQHRFGVAERAGIAKKGDNPDCLVMSATPIPRSLSLVLFGGLAVSEITTRPSGESKIKTSLVANKKEADMWNYLKTEIETNAGKCFVIVPRIGETGESTDLNSVKEIKSRIEEFGIEKSIIGMVHGKMPKEDASYEINRFKSGETKILISTTLVEVGIDVPSANLMVIYNGDRFGLATLHQLRGRIGRDGREGYCFVMADTTSEQAMKRLEMFKKYNSGIKLAEEDLKLRGAGTMYGTNQHGASEVFLNLDFSLEVYKKASEITGKLSSLEVEAIYPKAENKFGDIYKKIVLN